MNIYINFNGQRGLDSTRLCMKHLHQLLTRDPYEFRLYDNKNGEFIADKAKSIGCITVLHHLYLH